MANYTSDYSFTIDGISSDTHGIWVDTLNPVPHAKQRYTSGYTGSDEPYALPDDVFEPIKYNITFYKFFPTSLDDSALRAYLIKGSVLQLSILPDVYFKILSITTQQVSQTADNKRINYVLSLTLKPFRYLVSNDWITLSKGDTVVNNGTWKSKPLIELTDPDGDITLKVNNVDYKITGLTASQSETPNKYYIDSDRFIIYNQNNELITGKDSGKLPELIVGNNVITWTGTVTTVKIKLNRREI